ncbi:FAD linked oxidase-like protein [Thermothelomyces heterothallicus CBS 203.75]
MAKPERSLTEFIDSLQLPGQQAAELTAELQKDAELVSFLEARAHSGQESSSSSTTTATTTTTTPATTTGLSAACRVLQTALGSGKVVSADNETEVNATWSATTWQTPACAVLPDSAQGVATTLRTARFFGVPFAVRSGGHSPNPGHSSVASPGILIDLRRLDGIAVGPGAGTVTVGPGQRWGAVIEALDPHKVTVIGGRNPTVGVGGLILGGGYFHFSPQFGLAADNVKSFEVVLADGSIVKASACKNSDLFWALKGGGPNFGIVTSFELYTIPVHDVWVEGLAFSPAQVPDVFEAYAAFQKSTTSDIKATVSVVVSLDIVLVALLYTEPAANRPQAFSPFDKLTPLSVILPPTNMTVLQFSQISAGTQPDTASRHDYRAASSKIDAQLYTDVYNIWLERATKVKEATGANQTFTIQTFSKNLVQQGIKKGGNPLGMPLEDFQCWTTLMDWNEAADDAAVRSVAIETTEAWARLSAQRGLGVDYLYLNDASRDQNPLASYGPANVARLKAVAAKYDPDRVFQTLQNDGFLLRDV